MSKIICDVCGTSYQDSAMQCPICGCVRPVDVFTETQTEELNNDRARNYTYVKGGRFSKANVQKRNQGIKLETNSSGDIQKTEENAKSAKSDKGLVIAICALLLAIVAVAVYIVIHYFAPADSGGSKPTLPQQASTSQTTTVSTEAENVPCTGLVLSKTEVTLNSVGDIYLLDVAISPENTTDELTFVSDDESVATVSENGEITAMAPGETVVTVTCGAASAQCKVICYIEEGTVAPTQNPNAESNSFRAPYKINKTDVSILVGETFQLKLIDANGEVIPVTWSPTISDICTVDGNSITGAEKGRTDLSVTYNGETFTCIVRVK